MAEFAVELRRGAEMLDALNGSTEVSQVRAAIHRLMGVSRTLGAAQLVQALEGLSRSLGSEAVEEKLAQVRDTLQDTLPEVLHWLETAPVAEAARDATD
jgi:HPt (histidine-containing phosphotransfer) domain-containing protein